MESFTEAVMRIARSDRRLTTPKAVWRKILSESVRELADLCAAYREIGRFDDLPIDRIETALTGRAENLDPHAVAEVVLDNAEGINAGRSWEETAIRIHALTQKLRDSLEYYRYMRQLDES